MKKIFTLIMITFALFSYGQIGIGTKTLEAVLTVETIGALPIMRLQPQDNPVGTETGQMAVINDNLFMYSKERSKWLSMDQMTLEYGRQNNSGDQNGYAEYGGFDVEEIGPLMPFDGTIVAISMQARENNNALVKLRINGAEVPNDSDPTKDGQISLDANKRFVSSAMDIDFNAGDNINIEVDNGSVKDLAIRLTVKWRK